MSYSREGLFYVSVKNKNSNEYFRSFKNNNNNYLIAEENQEYIITIETTKEKDKYYALDLHIDGIHVENGIKTFKDKTTVFGLKRGGGMYESFVFSLPSLEDLNEGIEGNNIGTISIIFYSCNLLEGSCNNLTKKARRKKFTPVSIPENKKYVGGLITKIGKTYSHSVKFEKRKNTPLYFYKYDGIIDDIDIVYSKFEYFEIKRLLDASNPSDVKYIPKSLYKNEYYIQRIIIGFFKNKESLNLDEIKEMFLKVARNKIEDYVNLLDFFRNKPNFFKFKDDYLVEMIYKERNGIIQN